MILRCIKDDEYALTKDEKYAVLQITPNERLVQVINDKGEKEWYPTFVFDY